MAEIVADKPFLPRQRTLVVIHGNIGAGKSTTLRFLSSKYERYVATGEVVIIPEPVEDWIDAGILQALYDNALSSGVFQLAALATRVGAWSKILQDDKARLIFAERSPASDRAIFAKTLLTGHELVAYNLAYNAIAPVEPRRTVHIVLECKIDVLVERVAQRGRLAETGPTFTPDYLSRIEAAHAPYLTTIPIENRFYIDANLPPCDITDQICIKLFDWEMARKDRVRRSYTSLGDSDDEVIDVDKIDNVGSSAVSTQETMAPDALEGATSNTEVGAGYGAAPPASVTGSENSSVSESAPAGARDDDDGQPCVLCAPGACDCYL